MGGAWRPISDRSSRPRHLCTIDVPWICAQRWERVLFMSWEVPVEWSGRSCPSASTSTIHDVGPTYRCFPLKMAKVHCGASPGSRT